MLNDFENFDNQEILDHHKQFCNLPDAELDWIYSGGQGINYKINTKFEYTDFEVPLWNNSTAFVSYARSNELQKLFYGDNLKYLNNERLLGLAIEGFKINPFRHPIL